MLNDLRNQGLTTHRLKVRPINIKEITLMMMTPLSKCDLSLFSSFLKRTINLFSQSWDYSEVIFRIHSLLSKVSSGPVVKTFKI